jgi:predicted ester cyclase
VQQRLFENEKALTVTNFDECAAERSRNSDALEEFQNSYVECNGVTHALENYKQMLMAKLLEETERTSRRPDTTGWMS